MHSTEKTAPKPTVIILMGVSGAGKTTIGQLLATQMGWTFADADDFHPPANIEKMAAGNPLTDDDRKPWLTAIREFVDRQLQNKQPTIVTCSALKASYRALLEPDRHGVQLIHLNGTYDQIHERISQREEHFFDAALLTTQFEALEPPTSSEALIVEIAGSPKEIVATIRRTLSLSAVEAES